MRLIVMIVAAGGLAALLRPWIRRRREWRRARREAERRRPRYDAGWP